MRVRHPRLRRAGAFLVVLVLLSAMFTVLAPGAHALSISSGVLGGFENDGDQLDLTGVDAPGAALTNFDWQTVRTDPRITQWALIHDDNTVDTVDTTGLSGKEQDPLGWSCIEGETPAKDDIFRVYLASQINVNDQLLHIGYVRQAGNGDTDINVEFNKVSADFSCDGDTGGRVRSRDDLLISFTFPGGGAAAVIEVFRWDPTATSDSTGDPDPANDLNADDGHWDLVVLPAGAAKGADSFERTVDDVFYDPEGPAGPAALPERTFGEVTLDLESLFADLLTCPGLGFVTVHGRASHSFTSQLQDVLPEKAFNLSNCGSLQLKKVDDLGSPVPGVTFGLYKDDGGALEPLAQLSGVPLTCVTDAVGICSFPRVPPGNYLIGEVAPLPANYTTDPRLPIKVTVGPFGNVNLSTDPIVNTRRPDMKVVKVGNGPINAGDPVNLAQYTITLTSLAGPATDVDFADSLPAGLTWSGGEGFPSACSIANGSSLTCHWDLFPAGPVIIRVKALTDPGDCPWIENGISSVDADNEVVLGNNAAPAAKITILCPDLELLKDADATSVSRGDQIGFSITVWNQGDGIAYGATVSDTLPAGFDWDFVAADSVLPAGASCSVSDANPNVLSCALGNLPAKSAVAVIHVVANGTLLAACGPYPNTAAAIANNHPLAASDDASLTLLCPGLNIVKTADDDLVEAGDQIGFTLEVTNTGLGEAMDVVVTDDLPAGLNWAVGTLPESVTCAIAAGVLTCQLGDLPIAGETVPQVTIHLTADTAVPTGAAGIGSCGTYPNVASADPGNGDAVRSETVDVDVRCPLGIELTKTGPALAHVADTVPYTFTVSNTGYVDLDTEFADPICDAGSLVLVDDGDGDARLEIDLDGTTAGLQREVWTYTCTRVVQPTDPDPLPNTAMVRGTDADGRTVDDTASWVVDLIHPVIQVIKTVDDENPAVGQTVTYTYVVTNSGDTTLSKVVVTDDILGVIGSIETLEPGASTTLTKTMVVLVNSPPRNIGTATGVDTLGKTVTDEDDAAFALVLGVVIEPQALPLAELPRTGFPTRGVAAGGLTLLLLGLALQISRRRHQAA